jgi:hypothetical protein
MSAKIITEDLMKGNICPDCGGTGIVIDYIAECCRNPNEDGSCCNCPIAAPVQTQCCRCEATGYLPSTETEYLNQKT